MLRWTASFGLAASAAFLIAQPASAGDGKDIVRGAAIGGLGGAAVGAVVPGVSVGTGAAIGAGGGAILGATSKDKRHYRKRDRRYREDGRYYD